MNQKQDNNITWAFPWKYKESFIILLSFVFVGFGLEFLSHIHLSKISYPTNLYFLGTYLVLVLITYFALKKTYIFQWLKSPYLAIASISTILLLVILMGSFTQNMPSDKAWVESLALNRIAFSYPFVFTLFFFLTNLAFITINRLNEFTLRNVLFATNHLGIFITSIALVFSVGDIQKHTVKIDKDNYLYSVLNNHQIEELPFALRLIDFDMEFFTPKIAIVDNEADEVISGNGFLISADTDSVLKYNDYQISVEKFIAKSVKQGDQYYFVNDVGFSPSALLKIVSPEQEITHKWVSTGSFVYPSEFASLDSNYTVVMLDPEPKVFESKIQITYPDKTSEDVTLKVNQPVSVKSWDIYQTDYDKEAGAWSNYSVVEMVKDPWLPVIYLGISMLILGAILLMFVGQTQANKSNSI